MGQLFWLGRPGEVSALSSSALGDLTGFHRVSLASFIGAKEQLGLAEELL